jgi:hypothetical protein
LSDLIKNVALYIAFLPARIYRLAAVQTEDLIEGPAGVGSGNSTPETNLWG